MSNMSYCRWENTLSDLEDCAEHVLDQVTTRERIARNALLRLAAEMLEAAGAEVRGLEIALTGNVFIWDDQP